MGSNIALVVFLSVFSVFIEYNVCAFTGSTQTRHIPDHGSEGLALYSVSKLLLIISSVWVFAMRNENQGTRAQELNGKMKLLFSQIAHFSKLRLTHADHFLKYKNLMYTFSNMVQKCKIGPFKVRTACFIQCLLCFKSSYCVSHSHCVKLLEDKKCLFFSAFQSYCSSNSHCWSAGIHYSQLLLTSCLFSLLFSLHPAGFV